MRAQQPRVEIISDGSDDEPVRDEEQAPPPDNLVAEDEDAQAPEEEEKDGMRAALGGASVLLPCFPLFFSFCVFLLSPLAEQKKCSGVSEWASCRARRRRRRRKRRRR